MSKVKVSADDILAIINSIFSASDYTIEDITSAWNGKKITEILNTEYYTFKRRLFSAKSYLESLNKSINQSYCLVELDNIQRLFSKDIDQITLESKLTFWIQSEKIKLLEDLLEDCNLLLCGERFAIDKSILGEARKATVFFSNVNITEMQATSEIGESAICEVGVSLVITPDIRSYTDYSISVAVSKKADGEWDYTEIPVSSLSVAKSMTSKPVPYIINNKSTGNINLSNVKIFNLTFYGYNIPIVDEIANTVLDKDEELVFDNNKIFMLKIIRGTIEHSYSTVINDIKCQLENDTGYEIFNISLATRGKQ